MRTVWSFLLAALLLAGPSAFAEAPLGPQEYSSVDELALAIASYFPKVQGPVTAAQGDAVTIGLGSRDGMRPNMVLSLWRDGKEILHPVTQAVIGRAEDEVGTIEITSVTESSATAVMKRKVLDPRTGDRARISPRKINIAILPLSEEKPDIIRTLGERMNELGRFTVLEQPKVAAFLKDRRQRDMTLVREMGSAFVLDAVVTVSIFPSEGKYLTTCRIFYADEAAPLDTLVVLLNLSTKRDALGDVRPFFAPVPEPALKESRTPDLPLQARYFVLADVDGDGAPEYVFSDGKTITVLRLEAEGWKQLWAEDVPARERDMQQFALSAGDINGNGRPEIFVTRMLNGKPSSYSIEFQDGSFRRIAEVPGFVRVLSVPGRGDVLLGQDSTPEDFFSGAPREYRWSGGAYIAGAPVPVPREANLYNFVIGDLGDARPLIVVLDRESRLAVFSGETALWRSEEKYYPMDTAVTRPLTGLDAALGREPDALDITTVTNAALDQRQREVRIAGRITVCDIDRNGTGDVVLPKNTPVSFLGGFEAGTLEGLGWTGTRLDQRWTVKDLAGPVLDIQAVRQPDGTSLIYVLVQSKGGFFRRSALRVERFEGK